MYIAPLIPIIKENAQCQKPSITISPAKLDAGVLVGLCWENTEHFMIMMAGLIPRSASRDNEFNHF